MVRKWIEKHCMLKLEGFSVSMTKAPVLAIHLL